MQYRNATQATTNQTPAFMFKGRNLRTAIESSTAEVYFKKGLNFLKEHEIFSKEHLAKACQKFFKGAVLLEETYFEDKVHNGNSILRPIHYFPIDDPDSVPADAVRAAEHGDINLITLLMGASADGLQVLRKDGKWIGITALPEQVVVNVGDMLSRHTNNKLKCNIVPCYC